MNALTNRQQCLQNRYKPLLNWNDWQIPKVYLSIILKYWKKSIQNTLLNCKQLRLTYETMEYETFVNSPFKTELFYYMPRRQHSSWTEIIFGYFKKYCIFTPFLWTHIRNKLWVYIWTLKEKLIREILFVLPVRYVCNIFIHLIALTRMLCYDVQVLTFLRIQRTKTWIFKCIISLAHQ